MSEFKTETPEEVKQETPETETPETTKPGKKAKPKKSIGREILEWIVTIVSAVLIAMLIRTYGFQFVKVDGHSMDTTLADKEVMFTTMFDYKFGDPQRFDVVICHYPDRVGPGLLGIQMPIDFVKRVVGLPGDRIAVSDGYLWINGEKYTEDYLTHRPDYTYPTFYQAGGQICTRLGNELVPVTEKEVVIAKTYGEAQVTADTRYIVAQDTGMTWYIVPEGKYFVLGDNRSNSNDSHIIGPLDRSMIIGYVRSILWPISAWRGVK